jgi:CRISPR-associated protein Cas1
MPTLVLSGDCLSVRVESERLHIVRGETGEGGERAQQRTQVPLHDLDRVVVVGRPVVSMPVLQRLMFAGIPCYFTTATNRWIGSLLPDGNRDAARRLRQYEVSRDAAVQLAIARAVVDAKIRNSRRVLQRLAANRAESVQPEQQSVCDELQRLADRTARCSGLDELRGIEGLAAARYFGRLGAFFPREVPFTARSRRPPKDAANALLSWSYTILLGEVECEVKTRGLDSCIGFLHEISHGSPSLALDLMEPLRAPICDLLTLNLLNHQVLTAESFEYRADEGGVFLRQAAHRDFFQGYERAMTRRFAVAKGEAHTDFRRVIADQVSAILRAMNGERDVDFFKMP